MLPLRLQHQILTASTAPWPNQIPPPCSALHLLMTPHFPTPKPHHLPKDHISLSPSSCQETHGPGEMSSSLLVHFPQPHTWKTLMRAWGKLSNVLRLTCMSSKSNLPPKSCIPSSAKTMMKRKRRRSKEAIERTELSREATRLLRDVQYLGRGETGGEGAGKTVDRTR